MERLPVRGEGVESSHLAFRFDRPGEPAVDFAILYLHGFGSRQSGEKAEYFRARALAEGLPFASFDFRGHGESGGELRGVTATRNLEDVALAAAELARRGAPRLALFGSSMGGATALWYAALHPERIVAAAHVAPAIGMRRGFERWAGEAGLARWRREGSIRFASALVESELDWQLMEDLERYPMDELVERTVTPTLIYQGQRDTSVDWRDVAEFAARVRPGVVDLRLLPEGDHRLTDRKGEIWQASRDFFRAAAQRAAGLAVGLPPAAR